MVRIYGINIIYYMLGLITLTTFLTISSMGADTETIRHPNMYLNVSEIEVIKEKIRTNQQPWKAAYDDMIKDDDKWLNMPVQSVTFGGKVPPSGDTHDYYTEEPYLSDGITNPDADRTDYNTVLNVSRSVRYLGIAYALTGNNTYADKAMQLINVLAIDPETKMNPRFTNGQSKIELTIALSGMFYGADLLWNYPGWNSSDKDMFKTWTTQIMNDAKTWYRDNNFENWRLVFISSASVIADDVDSRQYAFGRWKAIIPDQMNLDGSMKRELTRTNSLTYSTFAINAMVQTAEIARHYDVDLYNYKLSDGRGLEKTLDFHAPYIVNPLTWPYPQIVAHKGDNAAIYELAYSFEQKPSYLSVINKWKRPMFEMRIMGPVTLTHANTNFSTIVPSPTYTIVPSPTYTVAPTPVVTSAPHSIVISFTRILRKILTDITSV